MDVQMTICFGICIAYHPFDVHCFWLLHHNFRYSSINLGELIFFICDSKSWYLWNCFSIGRILLLKLKQRADCFQIRCSNHLKKRCLIYQRDICVSITFYVFVFCWLQARPIRDWFLKSVMQKLSVANRRNRRVSWNELLCYDNCIRNATKKETFIFISRYSAVWHLSNLISIQHVDGNEVTCSADNLRTSISGQPNK